MKKFNKVIKMSFEQELKGKIIKEIIGEVGDEKMIFNMQNGEIYRLVYLQDCCAECNIEEIIGDLNDLIGHPLLEAEEIYNVDDTRTCKNFQISQTWTFYKLGTIKGSVVIRWYGTSNGYYSEEVYFQKYHVDGTWHEKSWDIL